jgi:hypothetical protein
MELVNLKDQAYSIYKQQKQARLIGNLKIFTTIKMTVLWRRKLKKNHGIEQMITNKIRNSLNLLSCMGWTDKNPHFNGPYYSQARQLVFDYFQEMMRHKILHIFTAKTRMLIHNLYVIQKRMVDRITMRQERISLIETKWNSLIFRLFNIANRHNDQGMKEVVRQLRDIKGAVKDYVISAYLNQCIERHRVAFFQWRLHFSQQRVNKNDFIKTSKAQLKSITDFHLNNYTSNYSRLCQKFNMKNLTVLQGHFIPIKSNKLYFAHKIQSKGIVTEFCDVGWPDPFPFKQPSGKFQRPQANPSELRTLQIETEMHNKSILAQKGHMTTQDLRLQ